MTERTTQFRRGGLLIIGLAWTALASAIEPAHLVAGLERGHVVIETAAGRCLNVEVYLADRPAQQSRGLMYVERMEEFEGMLFRYPGDRILVMWMKNTYLSLDMLFIRADGTVAGIAASTTPLSESRIRSPEPVTAVLELNAGFAERWGIETGSRVRVFR